MMWWGQMRLAAFRFLVVLGLLAAFDFLIGSAHRMLFIRPHLFNVLSLVFTCFTKTKSLVPLFVITPMSLQRSSRVLQDPVSPCQGCGSLQDILTQSRASFPRRSCAILLQLGGSEMELAGFSFTALGSTRS